MRREIAFSRRRRRRRRALVTEAERCRREDRPGWHGPGWFGRRSAECGTFAPNRERKRADTIGTVLVPWAGHFRC